MNNAPAPLLAQWLGLEYVQDDFSIWQLDFPNFGWQRRLCTELINFPGEALIPCAVPGHLVLMFAAWQPAPSDATLASVSPVGKSRADVDVLGTARAPSYLPGDEDPYWVIEAPMPIWVKFEVPQDNTRYRPGEWARATGELMFLPTPEWLAAACAELTRKNIMPQTRWAEWMHT